MSAAISAATMSATMPANVAPAACERDLRAACVSIASDVIQSPVGCHKEVPTHCAKSCCINLAESFSKIERKCAIRNVGRSYFGKITVPPLISRALLRFRDRQCSPFFRRKILVEPLRLEYPRLHNRLLWIGRWASSGGFPVLNTPTTF
jgi:hypothetical protein